MRPTKRTLEQAARKAAQRARNRWPVRSYVHGPGVSLGVVDPGANLTPAVRLTLRRAAQRRSGGNKDSTVSVSPRARSPGKPGHHRRWHTHRVAVHVERDRESQTIATALEIQAGSTAQMRAEGAPSRSRSSADIEIVARDTTTEYATYG